MNSESFPIGSQFPPSRSKRLNQPGIEAGADRSASARPKAQGHDPVIPFPRQQTRTIGETPDGETALPSGIMEPNDPAFKPRTMKILLVEDHPGLAKISCHLLRDIHGHDVEHVTTGEAALAALAKSVPDMVLLDLSLPDMHGYRVAEQLRKQPHFDRTILVALTGFGITGDAERSAAVGIDAHFRKPMDFNVLPEIRRSSSASPFQTRAAGVMDVPR
jgi:CheY-like chemotaxis protein